MRFKSDRQRKAVMAKLSEYRLLGSPRSSPVLIKATSRTDASRRYGKTYGNRGASDWVKVNQRSNQRLKKEHASTFLKKRKVYVQQPMKSWSMNPYLPRVQRYTPEDKEKPEVVVRTDPGHTINVYLSKITDRGIKVTKRKSFPDTWDGNRESIRYRKKLMGKNAEVIAK